MKKSEKYKYAMLAVADSLSLSASTKLEVLEQLMDDKSLAEFTESREENGE